jgi:hypothetical protein
VISPIDVIRPAAVAVEPTPDPFTAAERVRAVCQVQLQTATTAEQRARARDCISDMDRVIDALSGTTASPSAPVATPPGPPASAQTVARVFPSAATTGTPPGWVPVATRTRDVRVTRRGAVVQDLRIVGANLVIDAANVRVRRVQILGGRIDNAPRGRCRNGLVIEDVTIGRAPRQRTRSSDPPAIAQGGYTARRLEINGRPEGLRVGGRSRGCAAVTVADSYIRVTAPDLCRGWSGHGIQGYDAPALTVRNVTVELVKRTGCGGTAPYFYPARQGNRTATVDGLLIKGGGFTFRQGTPGSVRGLHIVESSWGYGPIDVRCSALSAWEASIVRIEPPYRIGTVVRPQPCNTEAGL